MLTPDTGQDLRPPDGLPTLPARTVLSADTADMSSKYTSEGELTTGADVARAPTESVAAGGESALEDELTSTRQAMQGMSEPREEARTLESQYEAVIRSAGTVLDKVEPARGRSGADGVDQTLTENVSAAGIALSLLARKDLVIESLSRDFEGLRNDREDLQRQNDELTKRLEAQRSEHERLMAAAEESREVEVEALRKKLIDSESVAGEMRLAMEKLQEENAQLTRRVIDIGQAGLFVTEQSKKLLANAQSQLDAREREQRESVGAKRRLYTFLLNQRDRMLEAARSRAARGEICIADCPQELPEDDLFALHNAYPDLWSRWTKQEKALAGLLKVSRAGIVSVMEAMDVSGADDEKLSDEFSRLILGFLQFCRDMVARMREVEGELEGGEERGWRGERAERGPWLRCCVHWNIYAPQ